jgi:hypothetical protein
MSNVYVKRVGFIAVALVGYTLLPQTVKGILGSFAVGWAVAEIGFRLFQD